MKRVLEFNYFLEIVGLICDEQKTAFAHNGTRKNNEKQDNVNEKAAKLQYVYLICSLKN